MALEPQHKASVMAEYAKTPGDTGSAEVQVALLTARIEALSGHLQQNTKDHHGRRGLLKMVGKRKRLLKYLEQSNYEGYKVLIGRLGLRR